MPTLTPAADDTRMTTNTSVSVVRLLVLGT